jgi:uncharacterized protein with HEPN domain
MEDEILKHLRDIKDAALAIRQFVWGKSFQDYSRDELLRSGVERKFEIIGEALNRIKQCASSILDNIREHRSIVSFRNILIHGYDTIDNRIVWGVIQEELDNLLEDATELMGEAVE